MDRFIVDQAPDLLIEYKTEIESQVSAIKSLVFALKEEPTNFNKIHLLKEAFQELWISSAALEITPVVENIKGTVSILDFTLEHEHYPPALTQFILLLTDDLTIIAKDVIDVKSINLLSAQKFQLALHKITHCKTTDELDNELILAISNIKKPEENKYHGCDEQGIDDLKLSSTTSDNPIIEARAFMASMASDPFNLLSDMSDKLTCHGERHTMYLQEISLALNIMLGKPVNPEDLWLGLALHDIGLATMSERLKNPSPLKPEEIQKHPIIGVTLAKRMGVSGKALNVIEQHHEQENGQGYPYHLNSSDISIEGKIAAIADAFHGMVSSRPQKFNARRNLLHVISEIKNNSGTRFDPQVVTVFIKLIKEFWIPRHIIITKNNVTIDFET